VANDAFMAGFSRGSKTSKNQNSDDLTKDSAKAPAKAGASGLPGLIGKGIQKYRASSNAKKAQKSQANLPSMASAVGDTIPSFKRGGKVRKTGLALLHRGEHVIPASKSRSKKTSRAKTMIKA
jgi:hypothetical protein